MKQNIWIFNHYATNMFFDQAGRHYFFSEHLIKKGYNPTIFCASTNHFSNNHINTNNKKYVTDYSGDIPFVFIKTPEYYDNGKKRIINMFSFYKRISRIAMIYSELYGKPDIIIASSVHPLTLVAGIKLAKEFGVPCICEVRDLWPETLVAYNKIQENNLITKVLRKGEKWIYSNADSLVFTMEGGKDYIIDQGWDKLNHSGINLDKIHHINNGVNLESFNYNREYYKFEDDDLDNPNNFKVVYTGSIRQANNIRIIVETAKKIQEIGIKDVKFLIYGDGPDRQPLEAYCRDNQLNNILFKGFIDKKNIPYVLSKSDLNFLHFEQNSLKKYGASLNKLFEYFASGKPILSDCKFGYDLIEKYNAGIIVDNADSSLIAEKILFLKSMNREDYLSICNNSLNAAKNYDFQYLTSKLISIIEGDRIT